MVDLRGVRQSEFGLKADAATSDEFGAHNPFFAVKRSTMRPSAQVGSESLMGTSLPGAPGAGEAARPAGASAAWMSAS